MRKEFRFRAWNTKRECWTSRVEIKGGYGRPLYLEGELEDEGGYMVDNIVIERSTGLYDKNGKEIYEGDIVKTTDRVTAKSLIFPVGVVEFKQQAFWICNVPSERPDFTHNETLLQYWETDLEVIGNVHEPPKDFRPEHLKRMGVSVSKGDEE